MKTGNLGPEQKVHGSSWGHVHGGYFADPEVARPLVEAVREIWIASRPEVIVDFGGGTGFLLLQLRAEGISAETALVNLDCSAAQLEVADASGISSVCGAVDGFQRAEVVPEGRKALFLMRSVLHYAGEAGLSPLLRHIRKQTAVGEHWIHQTACFERQEEADCLNELYRRMHTGKWYPTVADLHARLEETGWRVDSVRPAPVLHLGSEELGLRYGLDDAELRRIGEDMLAEFGGQGEALRPFRGGFQADLHYRLFVCSAAS